MISAIVILCVVLYLKIPFLASFLIFMGYTITTYIMSLYYYMRDYRLLNLSWNNFNELMQRGVSQVLRIVIQLVTIIIGVLVILGFVFWFAFIIEDMTRLFISAGVTIALLALTIGFNKYVERKFWSKFNQ